MDPSQPRMLTPLQSASSPYYESIDGSSAAPSPATSEYTEPSSSQGAASTSNASMTDAPAPKPKQKRSRVNHVQLKRLEELFAMDPAPPPMVRKEIAEELQMSERQTQIWFQNRRAKEKNITGAAKRQRRSKHAPKPVSAPTTRRSTPEARVISRPPLLPAPSPPLPQPSASQPLTRSITPPPPLTTGFDFELQHLLNETSPVTIIPATHLRIGTWKRVADTKYSLVTYTCPARRCLTWYINSNNRGFKMDVPYSIILEASFDHVSPGVGRASFILSRPPYFYIEPQRSSEPSPDGTATPTAGGDGSAGGVGSGTRSGRRPFEWASCGDWTEDQQGTQNLLQQLTGQAAQLAHLVRTIHNSISSASSRNVQSSSPTHYACAAGTPSSQSFVSTTPPTLADATALPATPVGYAHSPAEYGHSPITPIEPGQVVTSRAPLYHAPVPFKPGAMEPVIYYEGSEAGTPMNPGLEQDPAATASMTGQAVVGGHAYQQQVQGGYDQAYHVGMGASEGHSAAVAPPAVAPPSIASQAHSGAEQPSYGYYSDRTNQPPAVDTGMQGYASGHGHGSHLSPVEHNPLGQGYPVGTSGQYELVSYPTAAGNASGVAGYHHAQPTALDSSHVVPSYSAGGYIPDGQQQQQQLQQMQAVDQYSTSTATTLYNSNHSLSQPNLHSHSTSQAHSNLHSYSTTDSALHPSSGVPDPNSNSRFHVQQQQQQQQQQYRPRQHSHSRSHSHSHLQPLHQVHQQLGEMGQQQFAGGSGRYLGWGSGGSRTGRSSSSG
ncbi:hypothetical protein CC2G_007606 [Coprinopsis cinerea AmutBmut pab1-1]|nr:hypothetical protein CC2G_007606 [Coprinopsis cinerea AmutBmut pab1-1]